MNDIAKAVELLRRGRLVAFPTETVYGLGADATNPEAIELIYHTKGRPSTNPLIIHIADIATAKRFVTAWPGEAQALAKKFWPGPLTMVLPKTEGTEARRHGGTKGEDKGTRGQGDKETGNWQLATGNSSSQSAIGNRQSAMPLIPNNATANLPTVALRIPSHPLALELLRAFDGPLAAPSANRSTRVSPTTAQHVREEFPDSAAAGGISGEPSMILDGGPCHVGIESTVLDLTGAVPTILRPGRVTAEQIQAVIGPVELFRGSVAAGEAAISPGQQHIHYAPRAPAYHFDRGQLEKIQQIAHSPEHRHVVLAFIGPVPAELMGVHFQQVIELAADPASVAAALYATLRLGDLPRVHSLLIEMPPDLPQWTAIRDRLGRATRELV